MLIFVSGGTGFIGGHLVSQLLSQGHRLRLLVHGNRNHLTRPGIETVTADVTGGADMAPVVAGCDAVINLIGIIREFPSRGITFRKLHGEATRSLVTGARKAGISRYLHMSALGTRPTAASDYHRSKFEAEELVRQSGLEYTIFRPSVVFGPHDAFINMLAGYIRDYPAVPVIGDGRYRLQPVSADDVSRCFAMSLEMPGTVGKVYEVCGADRMSYNDMLDSIGWVLGKSHVRKVHSPLILMKLVVPFLQRFPAFPLTMDQLQMLVEENICDGSWQQTFHFKPIGFEEGIRGYLK